ncbi:MAG: fumarylacetoacetate hydrolase family protein [Myxococcota bacterium]
MKLATFRDAGARGAERRIGIALDAEIVDLAEAAPELPRDMVGFLAAGEAALELARRACRGSVGRRPLESVHLEAPLPRPPELLAVGLNYADHVAETGREAPKFPLLFNKQSSCVTGPTDPVELPRVSQALDYEGEMAFVIGRRCRHVDVRRAAEVIAGYTIVDDLSVRDWQLKSPTMTLGKSFDTHGPMGPWIVTPDELPDPHDLDLRTFVNGEERQRSNTRQLVFDCFSLVQTLSTVMTLEPGTVVSTGTPGGVGVARKPPEFLKVGDSVRVEVDGIGWIENRVIAEPGEGAPGRRQ